ncbi:MAG TPA: UBP-type zinc finger domain-containing protein [Acidimicrobiia bacterium]
MTHKLTVACEHFVGVEPVEPLTDVCEPCIAAGDRWVHLRACLGCGAVGCCDASKNRHARAHWDVEGHPLIQSIEPGETWKYCFIDSVVSR